jgi:hypothetical protein
MYFSYAIPSNELRYSLHISPHLQLHTADSSQIPIRAQPLPHNPLIPLPIRRIAADGIIDDIKPLVITPRILPSKECLNLIRNSRISKLIQTKPKEALQHNRVTVKCRMDLCIPVIADEVPDLGADCGVVGERDGGAVFVLHGYCIGEDEVHDLLG